MSRERRQQTVPSDVYSDAYWTDEFDITEADLERIAGRIRGNRSAYSLDELAKRVVRGRLRHGPEQSPAALPAWMDDPSARLWDPAGKWESGDTVVLWTYSYEEKRNRVMVGEIDRLIEGYAKIKIDDIRDEIRTLTLAPKGSENAIRWHRKVAEAVDEMRRTHEGEDRTDLILLEHGERVVSRLHNALQADNRFMAIGNRWFLHELLAPLSDTQRDSLFKQLLTVSEPLATADLIPLASPPLPTDDVSLFSVYVTLLDHPDRFENVGTTTRPTWEAIPPPPPPPERAIGAYYAYDPETYEVLLQPGQRLTAGVARRLQELDLYGAVVTAADEP